MKDKACSLLWLVTFLLLGCVAVAPQPWPSYKVKTIADKFDGYTINRMAYNWLGHYDYLPPRGGLQLNAQRYQSKAGKVIYSLVIKYVGRK